MKALLRVLTLPLQLALVVTVTALGGLVIQHTPGSEEATRAFIHSGQAGESVDGRTFVARVDSVHGATVITNSLGDEFDTDGIFVVVGLSVVAKDATTSFNDTVAIDHSGRRFDATDRLRQNMASGYKFQPGIPITGDIVFEVPRNAAVGLVIHLTTSFGLSDDYRMEAAIDLRITQSTLDGWLSEREQIEVRDPEVVP
jgi:hypothetical protein